MFVNLLAWLVHNDELLTEKLEIVLLLSLLEFDSGFKNITQSAISSPVDVVEDP